MSFLRCSRASWIRCRRANASGAQRCCWSQSRENLSLAQGRYQVGVGPLIDVTDAEFALTQAESEHIQAIVDFKFSEARLRKAMGLLE